MSTGLSVFLQTLSTRYAAISSIDMDVGMDPVDPAYLNITRHAKWVIRKSAESSQLFRNEN